MSRIRSFVRSVRRSIPGALDLSSPPDADEVSAVLDIERRASVEGGSNEPPSTEEVMGGTQRDIIDFHRRLKDKARRKVERLASRVTRAARRIDVGEASESLRDVPSKCQNTVHRTAAEFQSRLDLLREQETHRKQRLEESGEQDEASGPGRIASKAIYFVLMLAIIGVASLALGSKSVWGIDSDSLLPADSAVALAVIAVAIPFLIAAAVSSSVSHHSDRERPAFRLAIVITAVFVGLLAFFCAHLIVVFAGEPVFAGREVMTSMMTDPSAITADFNAWKGLAIVIVMGLLAFLLGHQSASADPDAETGHDAYLRARSEREQLAAQLRKRINAIVDAAEKEVSRSVARIRNREKRLSGLVEQAKELETQYGDYLLGLEESCNLLLERYREINAAARSSEIPASFSEHICFRLDGASSHSVFEDGIERHQEIDREMKQYYALIHRVRQELRDLNWDAIQAPDSVEPVAEHTREHESPQSAY